MIKIKIYVEPDIVSLRKSIEEGYAQDIISIERGNKRYELYADDGNVVLIECYSIAMKDWETENIYSGNHIVFEAETFSDIVLFMINCIY